MELSGQFWNTDGEIVVYSDDRYVLGQRNRAAYITVCGKTYTLTCHPYEPCLYISDESGARTFVHNAFDPLVLLELFYEGKTVKSISGLEYDARDFCRMVEYSCGKGDISISDAEKVFGDREKEKTAQKPERTFDCDNNAAKTSGTVIENDMFYDVYKEYPDSVIDYCLIKDSSAYSGYESHRSALVAACEELFFDGDRIEWRYDLKGAEAKKADPDMLFKGGEGKLTYRNAFLDPPYPNGYKDADFERLNNALFPKGRDALEIYEWTTDWSEYFDDGHEWWGTLCLTVYDKKLDRFAVIMASATD